jgi:hypothetical protein
MEKETLKNIFNFLEKEDNKNAPFLWKLQNNIPLTKEQLNIDGNLNLENSKITSLPKGLKVDGYLSLAYSKIEELPKGLEVDGDLDLYGCAKLESLPEGLYVGGALFLNNCNKLKSLPKGLKVDGGLNITYTSLTKYSEEELRKMIKPGFVRGDIVHEDPEWDETEFAF